MSPISDQDLNVFLTENVSQVTLFFNVLLQYLVVFGYQQYLR